MSNKNQPTIRKGKARVLLVDDHPILRKGLAQMINMEQDLTVCGEAEDAGKAFELVGTLQPDVAVVDISLKTGNGIELVKNVKARYPELPILVLSMHDESLYAERALRAGAKGYIMKRETTRKVIEGIRQILDGKVFVSDSVKEALALRLVENKTQTPLSPVEQLSDRELEVFEMLGQGLGTRQIADALRVSIKTVQAYCARAKEKLNVRSATELLREAIRWNESKHSR